MSAPVTSTSTLPEWNNCSDICDDVALDFSSRTSPRSKSKIEFEFKFEYFTSVKYVSFRFIFCFVFVLHMKVIFAL